MLARDIRLTNFAVIELAEGNIVEAGTQALCSH